MGLGEPAASHLRQALEAIFLSSDTGCDHLNIKELAKVLPAKAKAGLRFLFISGVPSKAHQSYGGVPAHHHLASLTLPWRSRRCIAFWAPET